MNMEPQNKDIETRLFEEVLIESIKLTAKLNSQESMHFYLTKWLSICRTELEKGPIFSRAGEILVECGRSEWAAMLFNNGQTSEQPSYPVSAGKEKSPNIPSKEQAIPQFQGYMTPDGLFLFDDYLKAKERYLKYQNFMYPHYLGQGKQEEADFRLDLMLKLAYFPTDYALYWVKKGGLMEDDINYAAAVEAYQKGLEYDQSDPTLNYFLRNNLGYSLNQLGQFTEGESWFRKAIEIEPKRANAHKNLGLALIGQERYPEAAESLRNATLADPDDRRALNHLRELLESQPDLETTHPEYRKFLKNSKGDH